MPASAKIRAQYDALYASLPEKVDGQAPGLAPQFLHLLRHDGVAFGQPLVLFAVCANTDKVNATVYVSGYNATQDAPTVSTCDPANTAKLGAIGQIVHKVTDTACLIVIPGAGEILGSGFTAGSMYVVGTNGLPAKSGDANYPAGGSVIMPLGPALSTTRILVTRGIPNQAVAASASAGLIGAIDAISGALSANAETAFNKKVTIPAGTFQAGDVLRIKGRVRVTVGATTDTLAVKVKLGSLAVLSVSATDYAADSCVTFDISVKMMSATTAVVTSLYVAGALGSATAKDGSPLGSQTVANASAQDVTVTADWSADSTDAAVLEDLACWKN